MTTSIRLALSLFTLTGLSSLALAADGAPQDAGCVDHHAAHHEKMLERFDTNKDGKLDDTERAAMKAAHEQRHAEMLAKFDVNKDGVLDESERAAMKAEHAAKMFKRLDADGDGQLTPAEVKCSPIADHFAEIDTDKNGTISEAELAAAPMGPRHGEGRRGNRVGR